jgi:peptide/nickel transport system permease protein
MSTNDQLLVETGPGRPGAGAALDEAAGVPVQALSLAALTWRRFRRHRLALVGGLVIIVAPLIAPYNPNYGDFAAFNAPPSAAHWLGTDYGGRDLLSRLLYGGRISLLIGFTSMITAITFGTLLGAVAGYFGGWIDNVIMRLTDVVLSFPLYLLLFVLSAFIAGASGVQNVVMIVLIIMAVSWTYIARLVRGQFLSLKEQEFTHAATALGVSARQIILRHLLPNSVAPIVVNATLLVGNNIILESVLSFFGFGVQPPTSSWGSMLADGLGYQQSAPWETIFPGLMILITVLSVNLLGDGLRDALDPFSAKQVG